jgi:hypothetical protein
MRIRGFNLFRLDEIIFFKGFRKLMGIFRKGEEYQVNRKNRESLIDDIF